MTCFRRDWRLCWTPVTVIFSSAWSPSALARKPQSSDFLLALGWMRSKKIMLEILLLMKMLMSMQGSRFYLLGLLEKVPGLQVVLCCCYRGGALYVSDKETELLSRAVQNMSKLRHLEVRGVANNALVQAVAKGCPRLRVLDLSESAFDDAMSRVLTGQSQIQVRGPLVREVNIKGGQAACKDSLVLLDLRKTRLSFSGATQLRGAFPYLTSLLL